MEAIVFLLLYVGKLMLMLSKNYLSAKRPNDTIHIGVSYNRYDA